MSSESPCPLGGPVGGCLVSLDVMYFGVHHFLIIYYTEIYGDLDPYWFVRHPCILHLKAFVLNIAHILLCYFGGIIYLEYESSLVVH